MIYLSPVPWASYAQRPHFLVRHFLACGGRRVLWVNPYPGRLPRASDLWRKPSLQRQGTASEAGLEVIDFPALPVEPIPGGFAINRFLCGRVIERISRFAAAGDCLLGIGKPSRLALTLLQALTPVASFYDAMDDFPSFHHGLSRAAMARTEKAIAGAVDHILVSSTVLEEKFAAGGAPVLRVPNACDPEVLPLPGLPTGSAVFGYVGALGEWFDWRQVFSLAAAAPDAEIHLVGPCLLPPPRRLPANVRLFPPCRHDRIGDVLRRFRAGLIPFHATPLTAAVDPIKFYEYKAMGLPVLSTRFGEMGRRASEEGLFFLEDGPPQVVARALNYRPNRVEVLRWRRQNGWPRRFAAAPVLQRLFGVSADARGWQ